MGTLEILLALMVCLITLLNVMFSLYRASRTLPPPQSVTFVVGKSDGRNGQEKPYYPPPGYYVEDCIPGVDCRWRDTAETMVL